MKIVFINDRKGESRTRTLAINGWAKVLLSLCVLGMPVSAGMLLGAQLGAGGFGLMLEDSVDSLKEELAEQREAVAQGREEARRQVEALSLKLAEMQARLMRLDALGERLTAIADLDDGEFDFTTAPAVGGPDTGEGEALDSEDLHRLFTELDARIENREQQLSVLESLLADRQLREQSTVSGRPVETGYVSSDFGYRTDPFTGRRTWHNGVDFPGKPGTEVVAVATGVVTWSGDYQGYGNLVEINHGEGFITRYAHNEDNKVKVGDLVEKGQVIAAMGSTGRSTGTHVHFEVYKNGRAVDPYTYIHSTLR
ncbi:MAG: peptidoglycan DD-metalloendopeptidase family protein [Porticoccaceae bacterium]|nr:peptidoglycan DD-metalloendopeptidase family protein [Porticoccaceae bacterium]HLS99293.1 peptidoglycan DD-metalloendopeptidase family protein [Porticoccaceae bacterium]